MGFMPPQGPYMPPGQLQPGQFQPVQYPQGQYQPGPFQPGQFPPDQFQPGQFPPGPFMPFPGPPGPPGPSGPIGQQPPTSPPPQFEPQMAPYAVDPGAISRCLYRNTFVWLRNRDRFWYYPTFVGRRSVAGYRFFGGRWRYYGIDLRQISSFTCY